MLGRERVESVEYFAQIISAQAGGVPPTCPWRAVESPLSQDVMALRERRRAGLPMPDVSARLEDAFAHYTNALRATTAERREAERKKRERERENKR